MPTVQVLAGNVGYLKIDQFHGPVEAGATVAAAMAFLANTDALIFDLRDNKGGDSATVALAISYLVPPQTQLLSFRSRAAAKEEQSWSVPFVPGGRWSTTRPTDVWLSPTVGLLARPHGCVAPDRGCLLVAMGTESYG